MLHRIKHIRAAFLAWVFLACLSGLHAETYFTEQHHSIDSLKRVLQAATGAERVKTLCLLAWEYRIDSAQLSVPLAEEAYKLAQGIDDPKLNLLATYVLSLAYHHSGNYPMAVGYGFDAKAMAEELKDTATYFSIMQSIVLSYYYSNNFDLAVRYSHVTADWVAGGWEHPAQAFELNIRLGWIYMMTLNHRKAIPYFLDAERDGKATTLVSAPKMALNYTHLARCFLVLDNYDSAWIFIRRCEVTCLENGLDFFDYALMYKGDYYSETGKPDSALIYYREVIYRSGQQGDVLSMADCLLNMGELYRLQGNMDKAVETFREAIEKSRWIRDNRTYYPDRRETYDTWYTPEQSVPDFVEMIGLKFLLFAHQRLYEIYRSQGDYVNALLQFEALNEASARKRELERNRDVVEVSTRYETERKEQQIRLLSSENQLNSMKLEQTRYFLFGLFGFILLIILVALLLIRQNRIKAIQDKTILEQRLLRAQMNPHFLFNTLSNIQGYMLEHDMDKASQYLSRFSRLMRNILDNTAQEGIPLEEEIGMIENYLELQLVRYPGKFDYRIDVDERLDPEATFIPPMMAQPFIENAIEHGIKYLKQKGNISIEYALSPDLNQTHHLSYRPTVLQSYTLLHLTITDNGVGREMARQIEKDRMRKHRPMATSITQERLSVLGRKAPRKLRHLVKLEIGDLIDETGNLAGTTVKLGIPVVSR